MIERGFKPLEVRLTKTVEEAPGIKSFYFDYVKNGFQYKASQAIHLYLDFENDPDMYHPFSIASSPTEHFLLLTTRMRPDSIYKERLDWLKPGDRLTVLGPVGNFVLPQDSSRQVIFLGSGIGITPFRSIAKFATDKQLPHRIVLLYSNRTSEEIVYRKEWEHLQLQNPNLTVVYTITRPEQSKEEWKGRVGRIDESLIREYVKDTSNAIFYLAGPPSMVRGMVDLLRAMKIDRIMLEVFHGYD